MSRVPVPLTAERMFRVAAFVLALVFIAGIRIAGAPSFEVAAQEAPPTSNPPAVPPRSRALAVGGTTGGGANGAGNGGNGGGGGDNGGGTSGGGSAPSDDGSASYLGPYHATKVMNLGGESLDGVVCGLGQPFVVHMDTPRINFDIPFVPTSTTGGGWTYRYAFPDLGETHSASGGYTISRPAPDGTRQLTIDGNDRVVFNGFDGPIPMHYVIGLTPAHEPTCGG